MALHEGYVPAAQILAVLSAVTMTVGNVFALRQASVKRLLAYSSIAQGGYLLVAVAAGRDALAIPALLFYLAAYLFMNIGAFLAIDAIERETGSEALDDLPVASIVLAFCVLSLAGFPPFAGFVGKVTLFGAAFGAGWTWFAVLMAINTALSLYPYARVLERLYPTCAPPTTRNISGRTAHCGLPCCYWARAPCSWGSCRNPGWRWRNTPARFFRQPHHSRWSCRSWLWLREARPNAKPNEDVSGMSNGRGGPYVQERSIHQEVAMKKIAISAFVIVGSSLVVPAIADAASARMGVMEDCYRLHIGLMDKPAMKNLAACWRAHAYLMERKR